MHQKRQYPAISYTHISYSKKYFAITVLTVPKGEPRGRQWDDACISMYVYACRHMSEAKFCTLSLTSRITNVSWWLHSRVLSSYLVRWYTGSEISGIETFRELPGICMYRSRPFSNQNSRESPGIQQISNIV